VPDAAAPFGDLLRRLRRGARLTQEELAVRANVGVRTLRDLETGKAARPQRSTVGLLAEALGLSGSTRAAFDVAARGHSAIPNPRSRQRARGLRPPVELIGRAEAVASLLDVFEAARGRRGAHVTLVGLAGIGKTALALAVAHQAAPMFPEGMGGVGVTDASTETEILTSMLYALGVRRWQELAEHGSRSLLIVDGADRAPAAARAALRRLRTAAPSVGVLATSRHPLGVDGEFEFPVPPLEVPPTTATEAEVFGYAAVEFFLDRVRRVRRRPVGLDEAMTLAALVRRLGGVPLALEIAAARGRVLQLDELLARCLGPAGGADPAGQSLRAAVATTWQLLDPLERRCLGQLAMFQWRWSIALAEQVLQPSDGVEPIDTVGVVDRLLGLGLVSMRSDGVEPRFWLLDAVRDVALAEAAQDGRLTELRDRHAVVIAHAVADQLARVGDPGTVTSAEWWLDCLASDALAALSHAREQSGTLAGSEQAVLGEALPAWALHRGPAP
jgi:predicted ATPase/DNA-binding XRE family transcriptional regulator